MNKINGIKCIAQAALGVFCFNQYNFFKLFPGISDDIASNVGITVYFSLAGIFIDECYSRIKNHCFSKLEVIFFVPEIPSDLKINPEIRFNTMDVAELNVLVKIDGLRKHFKGMKLCIRPPIFSDIQPNYRLRGVSVVDSNYIVDLEEIFGDTDNRIQESYKLKIVLAQNPTDGECTARLSPELINKKFNICFKSNYATLRTVDNGGNYN